MWICSLVSCGMGRSSWKDSEDPPALPSAATFDRVEGMLLGLAIGDALGNTTEARLPARRQAEHGEVRDYLRTGTRTAGGSGCHPTTRSWRSGLLSTS